MLTSEKYCTCKNVNQQKVIVFSKQEISNYELDENNNRLPCGTLIKKESILYITSDEDTVNTDFKKVVTQTGDEWYVVQTLEEWENLLSNACRIKRSVVINLNHVSHLNESNTVFIETSFKSTLVFEISEKYRTLFTSQLGLICTLPIRNRKKRTD